jgi:hypothetical protein
MAEIEAHESKLYAELAPLYDKVFGKIFYTRLERVIEDLDIPIGAKITGLSRTQVTRLIGAGKSIAKSKNA